MEDVPTPERVLAAEVARILAVEDVRTPVPVLAAEDVRILETDLVAIRVQGPTQVAARGRVPGIDPTRGDPVRAAEVTVHHKVS